MPSIQVKDVPDDVHATLRRRAAAAGMSLQEYLLGRLVEDAQTPTLDEVLDRAGGRAGGRAMTTFRRSLAKPVTPSSVQRGARRRTRRLPVVESGSKLPDAAARFHTSNGA